MAFADFFNWNRVKLRYCDGASFAGDSQDEVSQMRDNSVFCGSQSIPFFFFLWFVANGLFVEFTNFL